MTPSPADARRILIVKLSSLGDIVHCFPALVALRRALPRARIAWLVGRAASEIVAMHPAVDAAYVLGEAGAPAGKVHPLPTWRAAARALKAEQFDCSLDMQGLFRTALLAFISGARERVGFRNLQEGAFLLCNRRVVPDAKDIHAVEGYLGFARYMGADDPVVEFGLEENAAQATWAEDFLASHAAGRPVAIAPGTRGARKRWPEEGFARVAERLAQEGFTPVIVGSPADAALGAYIAARSPALDLTGKTTLPGLFSLLRRCRLFIGNDSGPLHLAAASGVPTVALFGPTNPLRTGPYGPGHVVLQGTGANAIRRIEPGHVIKTALAMLRHGIAR